MAKAYRTILHMGVLVNIIMHSGGNLTGEMAKLGWKRILMVSQKRDYEGNVNSGQRHIF